MKSRFSAVKYVLPVILLVISYSLRAQDSPMVGNAPITTAPTAVVCPSSTITLPVTVTGFTTITAMTLRIEYDSTIMTFNPATSSINPLLGGFPVLNSDTTHQGTICKITIVWYDVYPHTLSSGSSVATLGFHYINGTTSLHFNNISNAGGDCAYAGADYNQLNDLPTSTYYLDGQISNPSAGAVSGSSNITFGSSTGTLTLNNYTGNVIKWQKQFNGGGYIDITPFNTSPTYSTTPDTTGVWNYRAVVQYGSCPQAFSTPATDTVTAVNHQKTWTGSASTNWKKSVNWNPYGIPMLSENVTIPAGPSNMPIVFNQGLGCNNLTVAGGATLNINTGIHLNINGSLNIGP